MIRAIDHSVNIVAYEKNNKKYAMCVAWATHIAPEIIICVMGPQSVTGRMLEKNDIVGFSNLSINQKAIAQKIGDVKAHSPEANKLDGVDYVNENGAITINGARTQAVCKVLDKTRIPGIQSENITCLQIIKASVNENVKALHIADMH